MSIINHWPLQKDLLDTVGGNDGTVGAGSLAFSPVTAGNQAPVYDGTFYIALTSAVATSAGADFTIFTRFANSIAGTGVLLGIDGVANPSLRITLDTRFVYRLPGSGATTVNVSAMGTTEHSVMLVHLANDTVNFYLDGVLIGNQASQAGDFDFDAIGKRSTEVHGGQIWDTRLYDSDESANAAAIHADTPPFGAVRGSQSLTNLVPFNDFGF